MPQIRHDGVEGTADVPEQVLPFWTGPAGWVLVDPAADKPQRRSRSSSRRTTKKTASASAPAPAPGAGDRDVVSGQDASDTTNPEE